MASIPRLPIWLYLFVGLFVLGIGWLIKIAIDLQEDNKAEALLRPAPEAVLLEEFDASRHVGAGNEVTIRAQVALDITSQVSTIIDDQTRLGTYFGLFPVTALDSRRAVSAILLSEDTILGDDYLAEKMVGQGPFGPIIEVNGAVGSASNVQVQIARNFESVGRTFRDDVLTIVPFLEGRSVALRPDPDKGSQVFSIFAIVGGIYIAYGLFRWYRRRRAARAP